MPGMDGIEACRLVKADERMGDIPVILMTVRDDQEVLDQAFAAGAADYIVKPIKIGELLARVRSTLLLKREIDRRKEGEFQILLLSDRLAEYHQPLSGGATVHPEEDPGNKIFFDKLLKMEWDRAKRETLPLSVVLLALDGSGKGQDDGDGGEAVRQILQVAESLAAAVKRPGDMVLQYEYAIFAAILPNTGSSGALVVADSFRQKVAEPGRGHDTGNPGASPTVSIGVATLIPDNDSDYRTLLIQALAALRSAERLGSGRIEIFPRPDEEIVQIIPCPLAET
jgi:diguanylate cyclase (GGDEF)-like protein